MPSAKMPRDQSAEELKVLLEHANENSRRMSAKAEAMEAERDYWAARCALLDPVIAAAQAIATDPHTLGEMFDNLRAAGNEFLVRAYQLNQSREAEIKERKKNG